MPSTVSAIQDGYSLTYPTSAMECWVTHTVNHQTHRNLSLDFRFAAAMRGVLASAQASNNLVMRNRRLSAMDRIL